MAKATLTSTDHPALWKNNLGYKPTRDPEVNASLTRTVHQTWLAYWSDHLVAAIRQAIANPHPTTIEDLDLLHVVRCARAAHWRALKVHRRLREDNM